MTVQTCYFINTLPPRKSVCAGMARLKSMQWGDISLLCNKLIIYFICRQNDLKCSQWWTEPVDYFRTKYYIDLPLLV